MLLLERFYGNSCMLGHMMYGYTLLVPMKQIVLKKLSKERKL